MAANYGVNFNIQNSASSPISIQSDTPIGIIASIDGVNKKMIYEKAGFKEEDQMPIFAFSNSKKALVFINDLVKDNNLQDFNLIDTLNCINDQNVNCVIIISFFEKDEENENTLANAIDAIEMFKKSKLRTGFVPDIIIAPYYSSENGIKTKLESVAKAMRITAIVDLYANSVGEAINTMEAFSSKRLIATWPRVQILNSKGEYSFVPQSPIIAAMIAHTDADKEYGFSDSYSNRVMNSVVGMEHFVEFVNGQDCDADRLRKNHISTCILFEGYRSWGGETSDEDTIWQDLARVRTFDRIAIAGQKAAFKAIDKKASELYFVKISVEEMLRNLKGAKVLIGYEVSWDEEQNTPSNVSAGKFYLNVKMMNNPIVKQLTINFLYTDEYSDELVDMISKE